MTNDIDPKEKEEEQEKLALDSPPVVISRYGAYTRIRRGKVDYIQYPVNHPDRKKDTMEALMTVSAGALVSWDPSSLMPPRPDTPVPPKAEVQPMNSYQKEKQARKQDPAKALKWEEQHAAQRETLVKKKNDVLAGADDVLKNAVKETYNKADAKRDRSGAKKAASTSEPAKEKPSKKQKKGSPKAPKATRSPSV